MTINLSDNSPRISYSVADGVTQTSFTVPFEFFDDDDLNVYVDGTLKTLTTDYTTTGGDGSTGTVSISVTGASGGSTVVITRDIDIERTTDFPTSGPFQIAALNTELDRITAIAADLDDRAARALQLTDYDAAAGLTLPELDTRKGKTLAFNASTGAVEAGPSTSDVQSVSDTAADIALLADIEDGTLATNAITNVNTIRTDVTTVAANDANVTTVANANTNIDILAAKYDGTTDQSSGTNLNITQVDIVADNIASVNTVATNISDVVAVAADLAEQVSEIVTVADDLNETTSEIDTVATNITSVNTVGGDIANVNTVAGEISPTNNISTVAGVSTDIATLADIQDGTTATNAITAAAGVATEITTVAGQISPTNNISTVAGISTEIQTVAGASTNIGTVATDISNINSVAGNSTNINAVAGNETNINAVAGDATDIGTVATDLAGSNTIGTVAGAITNVNTVATNITGVNSFAERYRVEATNPTTSLDAGDLAYITGDSVLKYYNGTSWQSISPGIGAVSDDSNPSLGGNLNLASNNITGTGNVTITGSVTSDNLAEHVVRLVADGAISDGDVVSLTSEGKVKTVGETTISSATLSNRTEIYNGNGFTVGGFDFCYYASQKKILAIYQDDTDTDDAKAVAIDINPDGSFTVGTAVTFDTASNALMRIEYDDEHDVAVVAYNQTADLHAITLKLEGSTITAGTSIEVHTYQPDHITLHYMPEYSCHVLVYESVTGTELRSSILKIDNTGTFPQVTSTLTHRITTSAVRYPDIAYHKPTGHFIVIYEDDSYNDQATIRTLRLTEDGQYMTIGSGFSLGDLSVDYTNVVVDPKTGYIYTVFVDGTLTELKVYSYDGETFTYESAYTIDTNAFTPDITYHPPTGKYVVTYTKLSQVSSTPEVLYSRSFKPSGPNVIWDDADNDLSIDYIYGLGRAIKTRYIEEEDVLINMFATDASTSSNPLYIARQSVRGTYSNNSDLIGISSATYADGDTAKIQIHGSVDDAQSGLTTGWTYFVDGDGSLTRLNNGNKIGRAISSTKLLIDTAMSGAEMDEYLGGKANA